MSHQPRVPLVFDDGYLSLAELSTYSGLSRTVLRGHLHAATQPLPHYQVGTRVLVKRSEYDAWVRQFHHTGETPEDLIARDLLEAMRR
jgi:hypothetical protein